VKLERELELDSLFSRYGTDKGTNGYSRTYSEILAPYRDQSVDLLEVGIGTLAPGATSSMYGHDLPGYRPGASLRAWRELFPNGRVFGIDVQPDTQLLSEERITTAICDSSEKTAVEAFFKCVPQEMAVIIDDGDHDTLAQFATLQNMWPHLRRGGVYVLEDINPNGALRTVLWRSVLHVIDNGPHFVVELPNVELLVAFKM
jgi:hypothetical protein